MSKREWHFYVQDMLGFAENVMTYSDGLTLEAFESTGLNYDATVRNLELIGEAATHIPTEIREQYSSVPWRQIIATRNRLIHGYDRNVHEITSTTNLSFCSSSALWQ